MKCRTSELPPCEVLVSPLCDCTMGMDFVSDGGEFPLPSTVKHKAGKSELQARLPDPLK